MARAMSSRPMPPGCRASSVSTARTRSAPTRRLSASVMFRMLDLRSDKMKPLSPGTPSGLQSGHLREVGMTDRRSAGWYGGDDRNSYIHRAWMRRGLPEDAFDGHRPHI